MVNQACHQACLSRVRRGGGVEGPLLNPMRMPVLFTLLALSFEGSLEGSERSESKDLSRTLALLRPYTLLSFSKSLMAFTKAVPFERSSPMR